MGNKFKVDENGVITVEDGENTVDDIVRYFYLPLTGHEFNFYETAVTTWSRLPDGHWTYNLSQLPFDETELYLPATDLCYSFVGQFCTIEQTNLGTPDLGTPGIPDWVFTASDNDGEIRFYDDTINEVVTNSLLQYFGDSTREFVEILSNRDMTEDIPINWTHTYTVEFRLSDDTQDDGNLNIARVGMAIMNRRI